MTIEDELAALQVLTDDLSESEGEIVDPPETGGPEKVESEAAPLSTPDQVRDGEEDQIAFRGWLRELQDIHLDRARLLTRERAILKRMSGGPDGAPIIRERVAPDDQLITRIDLPEGLDAILESALPAPAKRTRGPAPMVRSPGHGRGVPRPQRPSDLIPEEFREEEEE